MSASLPTRSPAPSIRALIRSHAPLLPLVSAGGVLGSLARWGLSQGLPHRSDQFPWATWLVNVTGSFALGVVITLSLGLWPHRRSLRPFLGVGVLGGFTTFSTWMLETHAALGAHPVVAVVSVLATVAFGLAALGAGLSVGRTVVRARQ